MANEYKLSFTAEKINEILSKANDLPNVSDGGAGYAKTSKVEVFPETELTLSGYPGTESRFRWPDGVIPFTPVEGAKYLVELDGVTYETIGRIFDFEGVKLSYIGSLAAVGAGEDTGEPFLYAVLNGVAELSVRRAVALATTFGVWMETETVHTIDPKYLPPGIGYDISTSVELVPQAQYEFDRDGQLLHPFSQAIGGVDEFITTIDGVEYRSAAHTANIEGHQFVFGGSGEVFGLEYTGDLYTVAVATVEGVQLLQLIWHPDTLNADYTQHTVSVVVNTNTTHLIDPKYLPTGGFGYSDVNPHGEILFPETNLELELVNGESELRLQWDANDAPCVIVPGRDYVVKWNGESYSCRSYHHSVDSQSVSWIGNLAIAGFGACTGEPFVYAYTEGTYTLLADPDKQASTAVTFGVYQPIEVVHTIDLKYLPKGIGYDVPVMTEILPAATYDFESGVLTLPQSVGFNVGDEVVTIIDGVEYKGTAKQLPIGPFACVGNQTLFGGLDNGEPYGVVYGEQEGTMFLMVVIVAEDSEGVEASQHAVSVSASVLMPKPIDPKYLPTTHVGESINLDDYEIPLFSSALAGGGTVVCNDLSGLAEKIKEAGLPVTLKADFGGIEWNFTCNTVGVEPTSGEVRSVAFETNVAIQPGYLTRVSGDLELWNNTLYVVTENLVIPS